ncbi:MULTISPECIES: hypothetical protein [Rahnella]|jgi:uncharacterized protein (UPF0333 family)|uniref:hypothetical protein n=2 Tax=Yersiniaceae TaxID=1903411 RepID=UPI001C26B306|nr:MULTISPECIES: hypothetical protein [Rahnella]MBU9818861.1 hypothetical protein [Rahnella sp. BCC 1045]MDF1895243.1 hypothetical protein [Rahnella contaminans]
MSLKQSVSEVQMKQHYMLVIAAGLLVSASSFAKVNDVPKGALVVRYGAANTDANYASQDGYPGTLQNVSALCSKANSGVDQAKVEALIKTDTGRSKDLKQAGGTNASTLVNKNATVSTDPQPGNPNHCIISNIELKNIKGAWQMFALK